ncbi:MAG: DUF378 domain-containing protein [Lawsonibacter sp.]
MRSFLALLIVGGLNWGCIGLFQPDLVAFASRQGLGQPDQPDHLYSCGPVGGVWRNLAALPGHDGPARLTRQRSETRLLWRKN